MKKYAVIVAGGRGLRMGDKLPKQFLLLSGKPVLFYSIIAFLSTFPDIQIILVLPAEFTGFVQNLLDAFPGGEDIILAEGGETRFDSVKNGLSAIQAPGIVFVHDAARPLVSKDLLLRCYEQAVATGSAIPAIHVAESIRVVSGIDSKSVTRDNLRIIQTPQTFRTEFIIDAFKCDYKPEFTDEATVAEAFGSKVHLVEGDKRNIKITTKEDMIIAGAFLKEVETSIQKTNI